MKKKMKKKMKKNILSIILSLLCFCNLSFAQNTRNKSMCLDSICKFDC